jgi:uncharacterized repeat protein (TIGR03803 family)
MLDGGGNLYGTTKVGGLTDHGTVFMIDPSGHEKVLHSFGQVGIDGWYPLCALVGDGAGNLYGTASEAGKFLDGTVFTISAARTGKILHSFKGSDGANPLAGLIRDSESNLYGTVSEGTSSFGAVFKVDQNGVETTLHRFRGVPGDGESPQTALVRDSAGNLYGTTNYGGRSNLGTVFKVTSSGVETVLYNFTGGTDGKFPSGLVRDSGGNLYGETVQGGLFGFGAIFKVDTNGVLTTLYSFKNQGDGSTPAGGLARDAQGNLYGTTEFGGSGQGTVFKLDPRGIETVLHSFAGSDGAYPITGVTIDRSGNLYGTTFSGGTSDGGTVFKLTP